jgi:DNA mismatch repair protein MutL
MYNQAQQVFHLPAGGLKQRIINLFGSNYGEKIAPISEETTILKITGFIGKPEYAKKTRGEQFFFVNNRFIKNNYLAHAVQSAYAELIAKENTYPSYFIFMEIPSNKIDVNIHPTKTEIKFEEESAIYAILRAAVKKSLGQHHIIPPMDFDQEMSIQINPVKPGTFIPQPQIKVNPKYNPFEEEEKQKASFTKPSRASIEATHNIHREISKRVEAPVIEHEFEHHHPAIIWSEQMGSQYIVALREHKLLLIDQQLAWERIFYDEAFESISNKKNIPSQKELFPQTLQFPPADFALVTEMLGDLRCLGFDLSEFGKQTFIVYGIPSGVESAAVQGLLEEIVEHFKQGLSKELKKPRIETLSRIFAKRLAWKNSKMLKKEEREELINRLFASKTPGISSDGKKVFIELSQENIVSLFKTDTK